MGQESNTEMVNPMKLWCSFQDANVEIWAKSIAHLFHNETYTRVISSFLDDYLASSAPFRKIFDQYMGFWLSSMNLPSRDEIARLEQRLITSEIRLSCLYSQFEYIVQTLQKQTSQPPPSEIEYQTAMNKLETHTQVLNSRIEERLQTLDTVTNQLVHMLNEHQTTHTQQGKAEPSSMNDIEQHIQTLNERTDQVLHMFQSLHQRLQQAIAGT